MTGKVKMVCAKCGSEDVQCDAYAVWNKEYQVWELGNTFDEAYCNDCDASTSLEEEPLEEAPEHTCKFCGSSSSVDPSDQTAPADYCHPSDHGEQ